MDREPKSKAQESFRNWSSGTSAARVRAGEGQLHQALAHRSITSFWVSVTPEACSRA